MEQKGLIVTFLLAFTLTVVCLTSVLIYELKNHHEKSYDTNIRSPLMSQEGYSKDISVGGYGYQLNGSSDSSTCVASGKLFDFLARKQLNGRSGTTIIKNTQWLLNYYGSADDSILQDTKLNNFSNINVIPINCTQNDTEFLTAVYQNFYQYITTFKDMYNSEKAGSIKSKLNESMQILNIFKKTAQSTMLALLECKEKGKQLSSIIIPIPSKSMLQDNTNKFTGVMRRYNLVSQFSFLFSSIQESFQERAYKMKGRIELKGIPV